VRRQSNCNNPELLPYGYIFGDVTEIKVGLRRAQSPARGSGLGQPPVDELVHILIYLNTLVRHVLSHFLDFRHLIL
jgi:hypothetical protein